MSPLSICGWRHTTTKSGLLLAGLAEQVRPLHADGMTLDLSEEKGSMH